MPRVAQGGTIRLRATYRGAGGALVDPVSPLIDILDPLGAEIIGDAEPTRESLGAYFYDFTAPGSATLGDWLARWTGTIDGALLEGDEVVTVQAPGEINPDPTVFATVADVADRLGRDLNASESRQASAAIATLTAQALDAIGRDADWLGTLDPVIARAAKLIGTAKGIIVERVVAALANPHGAAQLSRTIGTATRTEVFPARSTSAPALVLADEDKRLLRRAAWGASSGSSRRTEESIVSNVVEPALSDWPNVGPDALGANGEC